MAQSFKFLPYFFGLILLAILAGFYKSYFGLFPHFTGLPKAAHLHAAAMLLWMAMLIAQPILIRKGNFVWHKRIGRFSYALVPFIVFTVYLMAKNEYHRDIATMPKPDVLANLLFPFSDVVMFLTFYSIAMLNIHKTRRHVAFMVGTGLLLFAPGFGRLLFNIFGDGPWMMIGILGTDYIILVTLIILDIKKQKTKLFNSPYLLLTLLFMAQHAIEMLASHSMVWLAIAGKITSLF